MRESEIIKLLDAEVDMFEDTDDYMSHQQLKEAEQILGELKSKRDELAETIQRVRELIDSDGRFEVVRGIDLTVQSGTVHMRFPTHPYIMLDSYMMVSNCNIVGDSSGLLDITNK